MAVNEKYLTHSDIVAHGTIEDASSPLYINLTESDVMFFISGGDAEKTCAYIVKTGDMSPITPEITLLSGDDLFSFAFGSDDSGDDILKISALRFTNVTFTSPSASKSNQPHFYNLVGEFQGEAIKVSTQVFVPGDGENSAVQKGSNGTALGDNSVVEGASVTNAIERGITSASTNDEIIAEWSGSTPDTDKFSLAKGEASHVEGNNGLALGDHSHVEGNGCIASNNSAHAEGTGAQATNKYAHAEGLETLAQGSRSHAEGAWTKAILDESHAEGQYSEARARASHAEGYKSVTSREGYSSNTLEPHAQGNGTSSWLNALSHAEGNATIAQGLGAHAEGEKTFANERATHAEGINTVAGTGTRPTADADATAGKYSHAEGNGTQASGNSSHAEGRHTLAGGESSHAEGRENIASGNRSHAEGMGTQAKGNQSHSEGNDTVANAWASHTEGYNTETGGDYSSNTKTPDTDDKNGDTAHAEGNATIAKGAASHSEGIITFASGKASHAEGYNTTALNQSEHAEGQYNVSNTGSTSDKKTTHSVGIGTSSQRKNAFEIMQNGDAYLYGVGGYTGTTIGGSVQTLQKCIGKMQEITWANLKALRDSSGLTPGMQYRITDYNCTTVQQDTQSANHPFDIIVVADDNHTLNENARAILHSGDTYFSTAGAKLEAWELKYDLDNDTTKYAWADSGSTGRGVIYWMKDEWNNECPYDFKNIQFKTKLDYYGLYSTGGTDTYVWTFNLKINLTDAGYYDETLQPMLQRNDAHICSNNIVKEYFSNGKQILNENIFLECGEYYKDDETEYWEYNSSHKNNLLNINCHKNIFGNGSSDNVLGDGCYSNIFYGYLDYGSSSSIRLGNYCRHNTFGYGCGYSTFGNGCYSNTFDYECINNTFGNNCAHNTFGYSCYYNTFGNGCDTNTFGDYCLSNTFGNGCHHNTFGAECDSNTFGDYCLSNIFGEFCSCNTFDNECNHIKFGNASSTKSYCSYNIVESANKYIYIDVTSTTSDDSPYRNVKIAQGVNNTTTYKTITDSNVNQTYQTVYQPANSQVINV